MKKLILLTLTALTLMACADNGVSNNNNNGNCYFMMLIEEKNLMPIIVNGLNLFVLNGLKLTLMFVFVIILKVQP